MKLPLAFALGIAAVSLPTTVFAQTIVSSNAPTLSDVGVIPVTATGSIASGGSYTFSTGSDLILGAQPYSETHGLYSDNTYNPGWIGSAGSNDPTVNPTGTATALSHLTDGSYGGDVPSSGDYASAGGQSAGYLAYYSLGTNTLGYNLTDIQVFSGWADHGRYSQAYTIMYSLAADPTTFFTLATVDMYPSNGYTTTDPSMGIVGDEANVGAMTMLTPTGLTGVADVEFVFNATNTGWTGYRELLVDGSAVAAPEPSTWAMLLGGMGVLAFVVRRRTLKS